MADNATHEPPMSRAMSLMAHAIPYLLMIALATRVAYFLKLSLIPSIFDTVATSVFMAGMVALYQHLRFGGLCLRCMRSTPLDPGREVNRNKVFLWELHWSTGRMAAVFGACFVIFLVGEHAHGVVYTLSKIPLDIQFFSLAWAAWIHHRLQPWCPYCRGWDEGGEEELVPDPDPAEKRVR
jgi:hypothetical protein